ncbi:DUF309 domain-containing protein [Paenibacillus sp. LHD-38]|uniref:DUF309 domain-containing protein n=1 Tax=Paenibacillus sp. LHD-38 TaxID=3072143 RepID=UPI00280D30EA|nr:DUF309 domain-containing protein [Paenibacillus sp. LHD-38]MDQ8739396.1 DUF309 domain-containing protein [Paenibacillus sp. LHD-38]
MQLFPKAYIDYLVEFHASRDYFECHELLEEYWKEHPEDPLSLTWVGLIQLAVGLYHERRGNRRGAEKMLVQAERKLFMAPLAELGIKKDSLVEQLKLRITSLQTGEDRLYSDIDFLIINDEVAALCKQACEQRGLKWGTPSPLHDESIIHRHTKRDRSEVILARMEAYAAKKREREG